MSLTLSAPTGQYFSDKLINLGTNRWAFKPELALSHPIGKHWLMDVYTGVWLFTQNSQFYTGKSMRTQDPLGIITGTSQLYYQGLKCGWHLMLLIMPGAIPHINDTYKDDRQKQFTNWWPLLYSRYSKKSSIKLAASTGAIVRSGADFNTFSIGWQTSWIDEKENRLNKTYYGYNP